MTSETNNIPGVGIIGDISKENNKSKFAVRPRFVIEGHEDEVYHELRIGPRAVEPEYCAFLDKSWTFNRGMRWLNGPSKTLLCYETGSSATLTGEDRIADWFSDSANSINHIGNSLYFSKNSSRQREAVVLPGLQFNLNQHPVLSVTVSESSAPWQVCVLIKGRSGQPLISSEWQEEPGTVKLCIAEALKNKGYSINFPELHIAIGMWTDEPEQTTAMVFSAVFPGQPAIIPSLPVVRSHGSPVPVSALIVSSDGILLCNDDVKLTAEVNNITVPLQCIDGIWYTDIADLLVGEYAVKLHATGTVNTESILTIRITDGNFLRYDAQHKSIIRNEKVIGPLSGSYQGMVFARDIGTPEEALVQGQQAWNEWHQEMPEAEHWHYWESLTEAEFEERFSYLESCGWDILHLCQGWGLWEKLDAGGHIAPHGAEQLALLLRVAGRHGLALLQALSHYPYGSKHTPVLRQYLEAGYQDSYWVHPDAESAFKEMFHNYLREFAMIFHAETAIFAMSTSGEGDIAAGPERVNDTYRFMQQEMPDHIFVAEPIWKLFDLPDTHRQQWKVTGWAENFAEGCRTDVAWEPQLAGSRMYWIGENLYPEIDLGVEFKFLQIGDYFMGEGSWPCPHLYTSFIGYEDSWAGTERYRRRVRDSIYLGFIHRNPMMLTWDEQYTEDERIILRKTRELIDWSQPFKNAPVAIRVDSPNVGGGQWGMDGRKIVGQYEELLSAMPLMSSYLLPDEIAPEGVTVVDARHDFVPVVLSEEMLASLPLQISDGYRASYLWSDDRCTLLAYLYNSTNHEKLEGRPDLSGNWHRMPEPINCKISIKNLPEKELFCQIFSLDKKCCIQQTSVYGMISVELGVSADDYLIVVTPQKGNDE